jgi:5-methylcytosine-specific restriction endonuclease McrA
MRRFEYGRLESRELHPRVVAALAVERGGKVDVLGLLGEIVARGVFVPEGFDDPRDYCIRALGMSPDQASRRLRAARTVHAFPALLPAIAAGRLGVTAVNTLGPHLTRENCGELIALAAGRAIEDLERALRARVAPATAPMLERVANTGSADTGNVAVEQVPQAPAPADSNVCGEIAEPMEPVFLDSEPIARRVAISANVQAKLEYAKALLAHVTRCESEVLERALDALVAKLEARKFGKTGRPRAARASRDPRHIPAEVRRAVVARDEGRCTFVGDHGHRCETRDALQFDHIVPVARGGASTEDNLRLRCRAHNQLEAERAFGAAFMQRKREARRTKALAPEQVAKRNDLVAGLRTLGYSAARAKWAAAQCADRLELSLEGLFRHALACLAPASLRRTQAPAPAA